jgi:hypothetical protein
VLHILSKKMMFQESDIMFKPIKFYLILALQTVVIDKYLFIRESLQEVHIFSTVNVLLLRKMYH